MITQKLTALATIFAVVSSVAAHDLADVASPVPQDEPSDAGLKQDKSVSSPSASDGDNGADKSTGAVFVPTLSGGAAGQASFKTDSWWISVDGYYTPYGKDLKGGGASVLVEGEHIGIRGSWAGVRGDIGEMSISQNMVYGDIYLKQDLIAGFSLYAGVGCLYFKAEFDNDISEYSWRYGYRTRKVHMEFESDPIFSGFGGIRWRMFGPLEAFCEYRYEAKTDAEFEGDGRKFTIPDYGGNGRLVFGGGLSF